MEFVLWFGPPFMVAAIMYVSPALSKQFWYCAFATAAVVQLPAIGISLGDRAAKDIALSFALLAVLPWLITAGLFAISQYPKRQVIVSFSLPVVWALSYIGIWLAALEVGVLYK